MTAKYTANIICDGCGKFSPTETGRQVPSLTAMRKFLRANGWSMTGRATDLCELCTPQTTKE
jgi:hypothetical protein